MVWAVVQFTMENAVEAVPAKWFVSSVNECFWPPAHTKRSVIIDYIKTKENPGTDWKAYPAVLLGKFDDFNTAERKASKAQNTSELSSNTDSTVSVKGRGHRKPKKNKRYDDESISDASQETSSDDKTYPVLNKRMTGTSSAIQAARLITTPVRSCETRAHRPENRDDLPTPPVINMNVPQRRREARTNWLDIRDDSAIPCLNDTTVVLQRRRETRTNLLEDRDDLATPCLAESTEVPQRRCETRTNLLEENDDFLDDTIKAPQRKREIRINRLKDIGDLNNHQIPDDSDFKRIMLSEMSLLNLKMNTALDRLDTLTKLRRTETEVPLENHQKFNEILYLVPIQNTEDLKQLEDWLIERSNQKIMINELSRIGGNSVNQITRKIMYRLMSNEVGKEYSWEGAKKKKTFKNLCLAKIILESVRSCCANATECDIIAIIKLWLVRSKDRANSQNKGKENQAGHEDLEVDAEN